jgi:hypothetical protein
MSKKNLKLLKKICCLKKQLSDKVLSAKKEAIVETTAGCCFL